MNRSAQPDRLIMAQPVKFGLILVIKFVILINKMNDQDKKQLKNSISKSEPENYINKERWNIIKIFNDISVGVIILNCEQENISFSNQYFNLIPSARMNIILDKIYNHCRQNKNFPQKFKMRQEIEIREEKKGYLYGFSTYQINRETIVVFISEIASKSVYFESKQENIFYDKLSELISEIAHEMGNPLSGINTSLQVLLHNLSTWPQEKIEDYIKRTVNEINRLSVFLKRMREVSSENSLQMKQINLKQLVQTVYNQNEDLIKQKKIKFCNEVDEDIEVFIDEGAFYQIILNLLNNSINILPPHKKINIYVEDKDDFFVKMIYRNNGKPIPEELLKKIFYPLYTTREEGRGIGLSVSQKLMTRMGGTMKAIPPEDSKGAKFVLYIPNRPK